MLIIFPFIRLFLNLLSPTEKNHSIPWHKSPSSVEIKHSSILPFQGFFHYKVSIPQQKRICELRVWIVCSRYTPRKACEYLKKCYEEFTEAFITFFGVWGHSFSTHTKFSEKVPFCTPRYAHVRVRIRGYEMVVFRKILCMYYTNDPYCKVARQKVGPAFLQY